MPPYGGYATKDRNVKYLLITGDWKDKTTEILYLAKGLTLLHNGGKEATAEERKKLTEYIKDKEIKYGGKFLHEIPMAEKEEEIVFYLTFQADTLKKSKKKMYLSWNPGEETHTKDRDVFALEESYNYQRQIGYINEKSCDYQKVCGIIEDDSFWGSADTEKIEIKENDENPQEHMNFLKLVHKEYDETVFTNLFFEFFNNAPPSLFKAFAKDVLKIENAENDTYEKIEKEVTTEDKKGRIDLFAEGKENVISD